MTIAARLWFIFPLNFSFMTIRVMVHNFFVAFIFKLVVMSMQCHLCRGISLNPNGLFQAPNFWRFHIILTNFSKFVTLVKINTFFWSIRAFGHSSDRSQKFLTDWQLCNYAITNSILFGLFPFVEKIKLLQPSRCKKVLNIQCK